MDSLQQSADRVDRVPCNRDSLSSGRFGAVSTPHALEHLIGNAYARHFIRHELCIDEALEWPDTSQQRYAACFDAFVKAVERRGVEHRSRDGDLRPRLDLVFEPSHFRIEAFSAGIDPDPD